MLFHQNTLIHPGALAGNSTPRSATNSSPILHFTTQVRTAPLHREEAPLIHTAFQGSSFELEKRNEELQSENEAEDLSIESTKGDNVDRSRQ
jgi:hypothetical protein